MSTAIDRAYLAIQTAILDGRYPPGAHLNERDLAIALGMSRTPVRDALRQLAADGYARHRPNSGVTVLQLTEKSVADLAELRAHLAELAGRLVAGVIDAEGLQALDALAEEIRVTIEAAGPSLSTEALGLFRRFHLKVLECCGNEWLERQFRQTTFLSIMHATYEDLAAGEWAVIASYYPALVEALRMRDGDLAASLMRSYFLQAKHRLLRAYRQHRPAPADAAKRLRRSTGRR